MGSEIKTRIVELRPGIYQFVAQKPSCHVYVVKGETKNVMIDAGLPAAYDYLAACLAQIGLQPADIDLLVLTHEHMDHVGAAPRFADTAVVAAHSLAANKIALRDEFALMNQAFDMTSRGLRVDLCLEGDATIELGNYRLRVLHTPGHCSGCICIYEPDHRLLFTGDTVMAGGVMGGIFGSGNISDYINSLRRLDTLKVDEFYPGHGKISVDPAADLRKAIERAQELLRDSRLLFEAMNAKHTFEHIFRSVKDLNG